LYFYKLSCIFHLSSNYRHDRLANKEHINLEWKELNCVSTHKEESAKHFGPMRKEAKMKRDILFLEKEKKIKIFLIFFCCDFEKPLASIKKPIFWLFIFGLFFCKLFFCF
jgi:hypothetical protein